MSDLSTGPVSGGRGQSPAVLEDRPGALLRVRAARLQTGWLAVSLVVNLLLVVFTVAAVQVADHQRQTLLLLADTNAAVSRHQALEWEAAAEDVGRAAGTPEMRGPLERNWQTVTALAGRLREAHEYETQNLAARVLHDRIGNEHPVDLPALIEVLTTYLDATQQELERLGRSDLSGARRVEDVLATPAGERLDNWMALLREHRERDAQHLLRLAMGSLVLTLLVTVLTLSLLYRQVRASMHRAEELQRRQSEEGERDQRDPLTGLWNRLGLQRQFVRWTAAQDVSVLVLDVNRLQRINDVGGHGAGDAHLRRVAQVLLTVAQPHGLVARWGGDEFVVLLPAQTPIDAQALAREASRLLESPDDLLPPFAYGAAQLSGTPALERVLALAHAAMYEHKERQRREAQRLGVDGHLGVSVPDFLARLEGMDTPQEVITRGLELACRLLEFDGCEYLEIRPDTGTFAVRHLVGDPNLRRAASPPAAGSQPGCDSVRTRPPLGLTGLVIEQGVTAWSNDYPNEPLALPEWVQAGLKSVLLLPVRQSGKLVGVVSLLNYQAWRVVTPQMRRLAEAVTSRLGHTLERMEAVEAVRAALNGGMLALGVAMEERDLETAGHTMRVITLAERLGVAFDLPEDRLDGLRQGASLHDIGKLAIPDAVLLKDGRLSEDEWEVMRTHVVRGHEMARRIQGLLPCTLDLIRHHHERWDGSGYPDGLSGLQIPLAARLFAVCDVYDALTSARPYKEAWPHERAMQELRAQSGRQFDPHVVQVFEQIMAGSGD